jgi:MoaD family protein
LQGVASALTIKVHLAGHLKDHTGRSAEIEIESAKDVLDVILQLDSKLPSFKDRVLDEHDKTRPYINIFVNEQEIRELQREATKAEDGDVIYILPSVAGGKTALSERGDDLEAA